jgi:hypothetical protein
VKRLVAAAAGLLGLAWLRNRSKAAVVMPPPPPQADPADELRAKLAESRDVDDRAEFESGEQPVDEIDVATKRQEAHDRARAAIDDLRPES